MKLGLALNYSIFGKVIRIAAGILLMAFYGREIGPEGLGVFVILLNFINLLAPVLDGGLIHAYIRSSGTEGLSSLFFTYNIVIGVLIALVFLFLKSSIEQWFSVDYSELVFLLFCMYFIITSMTLQKKAVLLKTKKFDIIFKVELLSQILSILVSVLLVILGYYIEALIMKFFLESLINYILYRYKYGIVSKFNLRKYRLIEKEFVFLGIQITFSRIVSSMVDIVDRLYISAIYSLPISGAYTYSKTVTQIPNTIIRTAITAPSIVYLSENNNNLYIKYRLLLFSLMVFAMPLSILLVLSGDFILEFVMGKAWIEYGEIVIWLGFYSIGSIIKGWINICCINSLMMHFWNKVQLTELAMMLLTIYSLYKYGSDIKFFVKIISLVSLSYWVLTYLIFLYKLRIKIGSKHYVNIGLLPYLILMLFIGVFLNSSNELVFIFDSNYANNFIITIFQYLLITFFSILYVVTLDKSVINHAKNFFQK